MKKYIHHPYEIYDDMQLLAETFNQLAKNTFVEVIEDTIGPESWNECPKDTLETCMSFDIEVMMETRGLAFIGQRTLQIAFGYNTPQAFWAHEIPPPFQSTIRGMYQYTALDILGFFGASTSINKLQTNRRSLRKASGEGVTNYHEPPTKWHYLSDVVDRHIDLPLERLCDAVDDLIINNVRATEIEQEYADWGE